MTDDEFFADGDVKSQNTVEDVPAGFKDWIDKNKERLEQAEKNGTVPFFIRDNKNWVDGNISVSKLGYNSVKLGRQSTKEAITEYLKKENNIPVQLSKEQLKNVNEICASLGIKRTPMNFLEANEGRANINYKLGGKYRENCQTSVIVHEMRRRGVNVTSKAYSSDINSIQYHLGEDTSLGWIDKKGKKPNITTIVGSYEKLHRSMINQTKSTGRYNIGVNFNKEVGHIISAERLKSGKIIFYDPQSKDFISIEDLLKDIISIEILKIDELYFNKKIVSEIIELM